MINPSFLAEKDSGFFRLELTENVKFTSYSRTLKNLISVLSEVGALSNSFYLIGFAFTLIFSYNLMISSLIRQLYWFKDLPSELARNQKNQDDKKDKGKGKGKGKKTFKEDEKTEATNV